MKRTMIAALFASTCLFAGATNLAPAHAADSALHIVADAIGGTVTSAKGPEAGVWVIAQTKDLPNAFVKIVVTDDKGRYVLPQLPKASYKVWVRGYGLIDSDPVDATPGNTANLTAKIAPDAKSAAQIYPPNYWYALLHPPGAEEFPGTGAEGNGIGKTMHTQQDWLGHMKENCLFCHQLGDKATREVATTGGNSVEAWAARIQMARADGDVVVGNHAREFSAQMQNNMSRYGRERGLKMFADWSDRIAAGELPAAPPPRPEGVERNVVVTLWDWADGHFIHDEATSDKRDPRVNANGPIYGTDTLNGHLALLDPATGKSTIIDIPGSNPVSAHNQNGQVHNPMLDGKGRVWMSMRDGEGGNHDWCTDGAQSPFAKYYPMEEKQGKQVSVYDPVTKQVTLVPVCWDSHHVNLGHTKDNMLYFSGDFNVFGWINTRVWDETHDAKKAVGWCPFVLDTSGDGKIDPDRTKWNNPGDAIAAAGGAEGTVGAKVAAAAAGPAPLDVKKDTRINGFPYGMNISPVDDSIWVAKYTPTVPSGLIRMELGKNPPETCKTEYYEPPKLPDGSYAAFNTRGVDLDSKGIAWVAFGAGELGRFDRSKCKVTNGPAATGQQCADGWTFWKTPGPTVTGVKVGSADWHYLTWVDLHNVFGLGKDVPIVPGSNSDSLIAFLPDTQKFVVMRVPYPMGFYPRGLDARIDDPATGWKGKALWSDNSETALWHQETGEGSYGKVVKFQMRPDPLAD
jgi:hypothetical protein